VASVKSIKTAAVTVGLRTPSSGAGHVALLTRLGHAADELSIIITELW
jgi:hypothetical protein